MTLLSHDDLRTLASVSDSRCVSVYLPTHRTGRDLRQDPIRLKNLLSIAEAHLQERGLRGSDARDLLKPARQLFDDGLFRRHQRDGLALFLAKDFFRHYTLPLAFEETAVVNSRFYLKPIMPLMNGDGIYYVLVLSQNKVQLLEGSRWSIRAVDLDTVPKSLAEALQDVEFEKQLQYHTRAGDRTAMFHGHGAGKDEHKDNLLRFFRSIDQGLHDFLKNKSHPLVLAGVEYYLPIYREANTYAHLMDKMLPGNHEADNTEELHRSAWRIIEPLFSKPRKQAIEQYQQFAGTDKATTKLGKILPSSFQGRISTLFLAPDKQRWGNFNPETNQIRTAENKDAESEDLYDLAAVQTFLTGGNVYVTDVNGVLHDGAIAALFRY